MARDRSVLAILAPYFIPTTMAFVVLIKDVQGCEEEQ